MLSHLALAQGKKESVSLRVLTKQVLSHLLSSVHGSGAPTLSDTRALHQERDKLYHKFEDDDGKRTDAPDNAVDVRPDGDSAAEAHRSAH